MRIVSWIAILLWGLTAVGVGVLFVRGQTERGSDERTAIVLPAADRDFVLGEMRGLLNSVQGVVQGLADNDPKAIETAAQASGMAVSHTVPPELIVKLPLEFKQMGFAMHGAFDQVAMAVRDGETQEMILARMGGLLNQCVACHRLYRLNEGK
jgi:cytochrome c556